MQAFTEVNQKGFLRRASGTVCASGRAVPVAKGVWEERGGIGDAILLQSARRLSGEAQIPS